MQEIVSEAGRHDRWQDLAYGREMARTRSCLCDHDNQGEASTADAGGPTPRFGRDRTRSHDPQPISAPPALHPLAHEEHHHKRGKLGGNPASSTARIRRRLTSKPPSPVVVLRRPFPRVAVSSDKAVGVGGLGAVLSSKSMWMISLSCRDRRRCRCPRRAQVRSVGP